MTLPWKIRGDGNNEWANFEAHGFKVSVDDHDGDASEWSLSYHGVYLVWYRRCDDEGYTYHFDVALAAAERAFRIALGRKKLLHEIDRLIAALKDGETKP